MLVGQWMSRMCVKFLAGWDDVHNQHISGRLKNVWTSDAIVSAHALIEEGRCWTVWQIEELMHTNMCIDIFHSTVHMIISEELAIHKVYPWWVPCSLTKDHWKNLTVTALEFLTLYRKEGEAMPDCTVRGDEMSVHHYIPSSEHQKIIWKCPNEPAPKKFKATKSVRKVMCTVFWDVKDLLYEEYLSYGKKRKKSITAECYFDTMIHL